MLRRTNARVALRVKTMTKTISKIEEYREIEVQNSCGWMGRVESTLLEVVKNAELGMLYIVGLSWIEDG